MTREEYDYVVSVYEEVITKGLLIPDKLRKAAKLIQGVTDENVIMPVNQARTVIYSWHNYQREKTLNEIEALFTCADEDDEENEDMSGDMVVSGDTNTLVVDTTPPLSISGNTDNTSLSVDTPNLEQSHEEDTDSEEVKINKLIEQLEVEYNDADDANSKRSLKMKINSLKKKLEDDNTSDNG